MKFTDLHFVNNLILTINTFMGFGDSLHLAYNIIRDFTGAPHREFK